MSDLVETWQIAGRITLYLLDAVEPVALADKLEARGWTAGQHFAHLHNNRREWLAGYADLQGTLTKILKDQAGDKAALQAALNQSAQVVAQMLERAIEKGKVSGFKRSPAAFMGYLVAHEASHLSEIGVILAQNGHRLPKEVGWGLWEWDKR